MSEIRVDSIERAIADLALGRPVVVLDAADREDEGDLIMAACDATDEWLSLFVRHGSGFVCVPMSGNRADELGLPLMVARGEESLGTAFTVTVDARHGVSTGISAADRTHTIRLLGDPASQAIDFVRPGHVLPLRAHPGGLPARPGHTEAAVALCQLAGRGDVGVIVELVEDDGSMRRAESCRRFADEHGLSLITIEDLLGYLAGAPTHPAQLRPLAPSATTRLPSVYGDFTAYGFRDETGTEHIALVCGEITDKGADDADPVLARVHSECLTGDVFGSRRCDCGPQLHESLHRVSQAGRGVVIYLHGHEGRGIGLVAKLAAYALQDDGRDTVQANLDLGLPVDSREYAVAARILHALGVKTVRLLTNNPDKVEALQRYGIVVSDRESLVAGATPDNIGYLDTKRRRMGHAIPDLTVAGADPEGSVR